MWDWAIYGAAIAAGIAVAASLALLAVRALEAWRSFRRLRRRVFGGLEELAAAGERTAQKAAAASDTAKLDPSVARLRASLARLNVLRAALDEAQDELGLSALRLLRK